MVLFPSLRAVAQPTDPRLQKVFEDWQRRCDRIESIRYEVEGNHVVPKGSVLDPLRNVPVKPEKPPRDVLCAIQRILLLDFASNRHRLQIDEEQWDATTGERRRLIATTLFDGAFVKSKGGFKEPPPRDPDTPPIPDISVHSGNLKNDGFRSIHWPMFVGHGIIAPIGDAIVPGKLKITPDIEMFRIHGEGVHQGRPCLVIRTHALRAAGLRLSN
jgi:hypothetical protein